MGPAGPGWILQSQRSEVSIEALESFFRITLDLLTLQLPVQLLLFLLQPSDPPLKGFHLLSSSTLQLPQPRLHLADGAFVSKATIGCEGEANKGQMLTSETSVRHGRADFLQRNTQTQKSEEKPGWTMKTGSLSPPGFSGHRRLHQSWMCRWARTHLGCMEPRQTGCCPRLSRQRMDDF